MKTGRKKKEKRLKRSRWSLSPPSLLWHEKAILFIMSFLFFFFFQKKYLAQIAGLPGFGGGDGLKLGQHDAEAERAGRRHVLVADVDALH